MRHFWRLSAVLAVATFFFSAPVQAQVQGGVNQQGAVTAGNCVKWIRNGVVADTGSTCGGAGGSPGGASGQVQWNNVGSFAGITGATTNGTTLTLVAPVLGTPASGNLVNATGYTVANLAGLGTNVAGWLATPSSANLAAAVTDETGSGVLVFGTAPTISSLNATTALTLAFLTGSTQCVQVNTSGVVSGSGSPCGGGGTPGGSTTQVQYNNAGAFGGITGATTNGTALTLVAPILGTPASGTLTNTTGFPIANLAGAGTGILTWLATPSSANLATALTDETGTGVSVFGTAPTISSLNATTAMTLAFLTGGGTQCVTVSNTGVVGATACAGGGSVTTLTPGPGLVSSVTAACSQTNITVTGTLSVSECFRVVAGTTDTVLDTDRGKLVTYSNTASIAVTLPQAGAASAFVSGWTARFKNINTGAVVITPTTSTINGVASLTVLPGQGVKISSDGTNYTSTTEAPTALATQTLAGANPALISSYYGSVIYLNNGANQVPTLAQAGTTGFPAGWYAGFCNIGAGTQTITPTTSTIGGAATYLLRAGSAAAPVCATVLSDGTNYLVYPGAPAMGTNVAAALAIALSAAGGLTTTIASGSTALGVGLLTSGSCATAITVGAANVASTDTIMITPNASIKAVTGYAPVTTGGLQITPYPTAGNVNFDQCNPTSASITPGAVTINWRVVR